MITNDKGLALAGLWTKPQFTDLDGLKERIEKLETVHVEKLFREKAEVNQYGANIVDYGEVQEFIAIVGDESDRVYSTPTNSYSIVQHSEAMGSLAETLEIMNVPFSGSIHESNRGVLYGVLQLGEPIVIGDEEFVNALEVRNSYNCGMSFGGSTALIRTLCANGMIGVQGAYYEVFNKHTAGVQGAVANWRTAIMDKTANVDDLKKVIEENLSEKKSIRWNHLEAILRFTGMGKRNTEYIIDNFDELVPEVSKYGLNGWTVFNSITAFGSHRTKGNFNTNRNIIQKANKILYTPVDVMYLKGIQIIDKDNEKD